MFESIVVQSYLGADVYLLLCALLMFESIVVQ